jgi:hypothetical protein
MNPLDEICPEYVGARAFALSLHDPSAAIRAFDVVQVDVDYAACEPEGPTLPLELLVVAPSPSNFRRTIYRRVLPAAIFVKPQQGGAHTIALREVGHNRWRGSLVIDVAGDEESTL